MLYYCRDPGRPRICLLGPGGISVVNIDGTIIYSGLGVKSGSKLFGLNDKSKAVLRNKLSQVKFLIKDYLSVVSSDLWTDTDSKLGEVFMMIPKKHLLILQL